jgi:hypothetical protein
MEDALFSISSDCSWIGWRFDSDASSVWAMCLLFSPPRGTEPFFRFNPRHFTVFGLVVPREVTERTRGALAALHPARLSRRPRCREFRARADARGRSPERHARDGRDRREVRRRARAAMRFFASPAIWRHDALFDPSNARDETRVGANAPPATARTSDPRCPTPSSRKRRCAPTARGGYPRVRGGPHLAGACPDASPTPPEATIPSKPLTNCRCSRTFPSASSRRVTLRHCARPPSARPR